MKRNLVLLGLVLLVGLLAPALDAAAQVSFQLSSNSRTVRVEGTTEAVGQLVLSATSTGTIVLDSEINVDYGVAIATAPAAVVVTANGGTCIAGNITVSALPAGTSTLKLKWNVGCSINTGGTISISKVRVSANAAGAGTIINGSVSAVVPAASQATNPITFIGLTSAQVAQVFSGNSTSVDVTAAPDSILICAVGATTPLVGIEVEVTEAFAAAFTGTTDEDGLSGDPASTNGSIIRITFNNVPVGITVTNTGIAGTTLTLTPVTVTPAGLFATATAADDDLEFEFAFDPTTGTTVIETLVAQFSADDDVTFAGGTGSVDVTVSIRPVTTTAATIPRFASNTQGTGNAFSVTDCITRLLFPFVANVAGFDTGLAFANTTADDAALGTGAGATAQSGPCTITLWPAGAPTSPVSTTTASIAAGDTGTVIQSGVSSFAGKSGFMIAVCGFLNAHGFAFISDNFGVGAPNTTQGYLALVIESGTRVIATGESLGH